jgi:C4-dicarboxylate-specific signal transduction histidine kinase
METTVTSRLRSNAIRYGAAIALVAAALSLSVLQTTVSTVGYAFFYAAVVAASWFGGKLAGALAVILSALSIDYFLTQPIHSFAVPRESLPVFIEFALLSIFIAWFSSRRREAETALQRARDELQTRVEERTAELRETNQRLLAEIAERKRAESAYREAQAELSRVSRLSALGALAASISHEVNQPLAAVVANADACAMWLAGDSPNLEEARLAVDCVAREGTRASEVVRRIRAMFTKAIPERASVQLNDVIGDVVALMQTELTRNEVELYTELTDQLPATMADRVQLQQVIVNLVQNGVEAMTNVMDRPRRVVIRSQAVPEGSVLVAVSDAGVGIEPKDQKRIFQAFFTTKSRGMGMGLSISHSIIEAHGGRLWASANGDHGTTFQFTIPVNRQTAS